MLDIRSILYHDHRVTNFQQLTALQNDLIRYCKEVALMHRLLVQHDVVT